MTTSQPLHLTVLALARVNAIGGTRRAGMFCNAENSIAGKVASIVHTALAFNPTAQEAAP
jgi:hypothetical protein